MTFLLLALMALTPDQHILLNRHLEQNTTVDLTVGLFDKQAAVYHSRAKRKDLTCGRRGGKTTILSRLGHDSLQQNPVVGGDESITPFIGPTKNHAKRLIWGRMQLDAKRFKLPVEFNNSELIATHENGAQFWVMGADDDRDVQRLRGFPYRRVIVDEAQAIGADFEDLVDEVLDPALADYDGDLILSGTPNAACTGYFYRAATGQLRDDRGRDQWEHWRWTVRDNPCFPLWRGKKDWRKRAKAWLDAYRKKKNWEEDHPSFLREWMGRWVRDEGGLVYRYDPKRNGMKALPEGYHWQHVLGIDFGFDDAFAMKAWAFSEDLPDIFDAGTYKRKGLTVSDWAALIKEWQDRLNPIKTVADTGALGKAIVEELRRRYGLSIHPAEKKNKLAYIDLMNSDYIAGLIHVDPDGPYAKEIEILQWDEDRKKEDGSFENDASDAGLYGWREAKHWTYEPKAEAPKMGTQEWTEEIARRLKEQRLKKLRKKGKKRLPI